MTERIQLLEERAFLVTIFLEEADELLEELIENVTLLKNKGESLEVSLAIRRIAHTFAGSGAISNERLISAYARRFELMMVERIEHKCALGPSFAEKVFRASKRLSEMISTRKAGQQCSDSIEDLEKDFLR